MIGMDRNTGKRLAGLDHLRQSIADILTTRIATRVALRDYGGLPDLLDQTMNPVGRLRLFAAAALALARWEPRIRVTSFALQGDGGAWTLSITADRRDAAGDAATLSIPLRAA